MQLLPKRLATRVIRISTALQLPPLHMQAMCSGLPEDAAAGARQVQETTEAQRGYSSHIRFYLSHDSATG